MTSSFFSVLGGLGLFFFGLRKLLRGFESFASSRFRPSIQRAFSGGLSSWFIGCLLTLISQSSNLSVIALMGLTEIGFISLRAAYFGMLGAAAGTTAWLWWVLSGWHLGPLILAIGSFGLIAAKTEYWEELMSAFLSVGLALTGLELLNLGVRELLGGVIQQKVAASAGSVGLQEQLSFVLLGVLLGLILQSASGPVVLLLSLVPQTQLTFATGTCLFLGANLGLTVTALILSRRTRSVTRRLAWAYFWSKLVGVLGALFLFPTFSDLVELVLKKAADSPNLMTQIVVAQLLFNLINSLIFGLFAGPVLKILSSWFPEQELRAPGLAKRVRRMLYQDSELAAEELERQLKQLELEVKANYDQVMHRITTTETSESYKARAFRERNFRSLKFTIHDLLFSVDRHGEGRNESGAVTLSLLEYYGALSRTLFHLEDHYEKGLSKKFRLPEEMHAGLVGFKGLLDDLWHETLLEFSPENPASSTENLEEIVLTLNKKLGVEYQGYSTWLMEMAGFLRLISSDLGQLVQRRAQLRSFLEDKSQASQDGSGKS